MATNFPTNPSDGDTYVAGNGVTYTYASSQKTWTATLATASGGLTTVSSDSTLSGNGTSSSPLGVNTNEIATQTYVDTRTQIIDGLDSEFFSVIHHNRDSNSFTHKTSGTPAEDEVVVDTTNYRLEFRNRDLNLLELRSATRLNLNYNSKFGYYTIDDIQTNPDGTRTIIFISQHQLGVSADDSDTIAMIAADDDAQNFVTIYADMKDMPSAEAYTILDTAGRYLSDGTDGDGNTYIEYEYNGVGGDRYYKTILSDRIEYRTTSIADNHEEVARFTFPT